MADNVHYSHKRNFTAGEISDILSEKLDFERYINGCHELLNMVVLPQGPATRREGFEFLYDLTLLLDGAVNEVRPRAIPFVFNRYQAYVLIFFKHTGTGNTRVAFATRNGLVDSATPGVPYIFEFTGELDIEEFDYVQSNDVIKIVQPNRILIDFARVSENEWTATEMPDAKIPPTGVTGSDWSAPDNWPTKVGFFEQRLVLASTKARPQTLWFSRGGDFEDFIIGSAAADDPVALTFNSGTQNKIEWLSTARVLLVGTLGDEWDVSGKGLEPLSFKSFRMVRHTQQGSEDIKPLMVGPVTIFVEHLGRTVSQLGYDFATDSYDTVDLSVLAPHLTKRNKIVDWTYQKTPDGIIWSVRDDGVALGLTIKREHNIVGWHRHTTDGKFLDFGAIPGDFENDVFTVVEREVNGEVKWYIEVKAEEFVEDDAKYGRFLDSHLIYDGEGVQSLSGLDHLEGKIVSILANGRPIPDQTVIDGEITFGNNVFDYIVVGLPFVSRVVSTQPSFSMPDGLTHHRQADTISAVVAVKDSAGFWVGARDANNDDNIVYIPEVDPTRNDTESARLITRPVFIDLQEVSGNPEVALVQKVVVQQSLPLPLTVLGITEIFYFSEG